jgi:pentatricopeptide repeat protein
LTPTTYAFELVIAALAKKLQWRRALNLLDLMEELGVPKTLSIYNAVLTACAKAREVAQAKALLIRMQKRDGIAPNIISYNSVLSVCASTSRWKDALNVLDLAHRAPGVSPDVYTYTKYVLVRSEIEVRSAFAFILTPLPCSNTVFQLVPIVFFIKVLFERVPR